MKPRFKGEPNFDLSQLCPSCGYKIQPKELMRLASHIINCPRCGEAFDEMAGKKPLSTS
jgi:ribosomal protein L37AE/L43A